MADTLDLLTLAEAKDAVQKTTTDRDDNLEHLVTAISGRIVELCGPVVSETQTNEEHFPAGSEVITLDHKPVLSVTTVTEYRGTTAQALTAENFPGSVTANDYRLRAEVGTIARRSSGQRTNFTADRVIVTYNAGRAADTASVPDRFKAAAQQILKRMWHGNEGTWAQTPEFLSDLGDAPTTVFFRSVDPVVDELLADEKLSRTWVH